MPSSLFLFGKLVGGRNFLNSIPTILLPQASYSCRILYPLTSFWLTLEPLYQFYPHRPSQPGAPSVGVQLRTVDRTAMDTFSSRQIALQFGPHRFEWIFLLADVSMPILVGF